MAFILYIPVISAFLREQWPCQLKYAVTNSTDNEKFDSLF
jgi:hypothetical protein